MTKRTSILLGIITLVLVSGIVLLFKVSPQQSASPPQSIGYTNSITGQASTDIPSEALGLQSDGVILPPSIAIDGISQLFNSSDMALTSEQAGNAYTIIKKFLFARSGLANVQAAVKNGTLTQSDGAIGFVLIVEKPFGSYNVTIRVANSDQSIPDVTFERVD